MVHFLVALSLMVVAAPFLEDLAVGDLVEALLMTLVLLSAMLAIGRRIRTLCAAAVLVTPALAGKWLWHWRPDLVPPEAFAGTGLLFTGFVTWHLLRYILSAPQVNFDVLCAAVATYLMLGLVWGFAYVLVAGLAPDAFSFTGGPAAGQQMKGFNAVYFSFTTLNTGGFGDIIPVSGAARMLAMAEQMVGMLYVVILIARLVALYSTPPPAAG
jgi:hypothetical protein